MSLPRWVGANGDVDGDVDDVCVRAREPMMCVNKSSRGWVVSWYVIDTCVRSERVVRDRRAPYSSLCIAEHKRLVVSRPLLRD